MRLNYIERHYIGFENNEEIKLGLRNNKESKDPGLPDENFKKHPN